ncbi:hypothetical protein G6048_27740 [Streptomyces sp. YC419]|uniref:Uncharacterized protein n=1 Tax=Streptomyces ureilyticus TaxID=1775131 RepID=A0ABX0E0F0_9ACTN|nr:hypothetical protein [Streptomyces ureilyticus]
MTEPTKRRHTRKALICGAVAAAGAIALLTAYLLGAFEKRGHIQAEDVCLHVPARQETAEIFNSVLPQSSKYDFDGTWRPDRDQGFRSTCFVMGDDDESLFSLTAEMGSARPWQQWAETEIPPNSGGEITYFDAGLKGVSNAEVAAIWVPCYSSERTSKEPWNMTVIADALKPLEVSDKEARQALIDLATTFARQAHKDAKCDLSSKLSA